MSSSYKIWLLVCIGCHLLRTLYEALKDRKLINPANKIVFGFMFVNMSLLWVSWFSLCESDPDKLGLHVALRLFGLLITLSGLGLFVLALWKTKALENYQGDLIQNGIYSKIRHPMYLGFIFWIVGFSVFMDSKTAMMIGLVFILNVLTWRWFEERNLVEVYPEYQSYKEKTFF